MTSIGLKDAFSPVLIHTDHQKKLKFLFDKFTCMPNGCGPAMTVFY